jgi:hypothetical protein
MLSPLHSMVEERYFAFNGGMTIGWSGMLGDILSVEYFFTKFYKLEEFIKNNNVLIL